MKPRIDAPNATAPMGRFALSAVIAFAALAQPTLNADDEYEPNDSIAAAYDLSSVKGQWLSTIGGRGVQSDYDWYKITVGLPVVVGANNHRVVIDCRFAHADGNIDIALFEDHRIFPQRLASSAGTNDEERIDTVVAVAGTYYIRVGGSGAANLYDLRWHSGDADDHDEEKDGHPHLGAQPLPDFDLLDTNPTSPSYYQYVSPRDYRHQFSAYFFARADCGYCRSQFGYLQQISNELSTEGDCDYLVEILGVNQIGHEGANDMMAATGDLPWLQDEDRDKNGVGDVWELWKSSYRELFILNPASELVGVIDLTSLNLSVEADRIECKRLICEATTMVDTDNDGLSDFWERDPFYGVGDLSAAPSVDSDSDSVSDFTEYAFGSRAGDASSTPRVATGLIEIEDERYLTITFRRRSGSAGGLTYRVEFSSSLIHWASEPNNNVVEVGRTNSYGGTALVTYRTVQPVSQLGRSGFLRVNCEP